MKWLDFARISVYYEYLLLIPFNGWDGELPADLEPLSTLVRNYGDVNDSLCQAAAASAFAESLVNKALRSLRVKDH